MNNIILNQRTPDEINRIIAERIRRIRKEQKLSQQKLSEKAGVSLGSIKRFEACGDISLKFLVKIAIALDIENQLLALFKKQEAKSIEEIING